MIHWNKHSFNRYRGGIFAVLLAGVALSVTAYDGDLSANVVVRGLKGPAGMSKHPDTGDIYVVEKQGNQVSVIRGGSASPVISTGWHLDPNIPFWGISRELSKEALTKAALNSPAGIAVDTNSHIFVCEGVSGGRLLEFIPDEQGKYNSGKIVPVPWIDRPFSWTDVKVTRDGRLFLVGAVVDAKTLHFGTVLMRDLKGEWWVVDYGPFMNFSSIYLSRNEDIAIVCDRNEGELVWWDTFRHLPIGTVEKTGKDISADSVALMPNGALVVGQNLDSGGAKVVQVDPLTGEQTDLVTGLAKVGGLLLLADKNLLYIADEGQGVIVEAKSGATVDIDEYLLQRSLDGYEMGEGFTPRQAPGFLKNFFAQVGAPKPGDEDGEDEVDAVTDRIAMSFSLREFAAKIPLIAGKINAQAIGRAEAMVNEDPLTEIEFVIFFPGRAIESGEAATPSLSYFAAHRKSGKVERTRELFTGLSILERREGDQWREGGNTARITIPVASVGMEKSEYGMNLNMAFLGLGIYNDYYLRLSSGRENTGEIIVESLTGDKEVYRAVFTEVAKAGTGSQAGKEVKNLVVAGFDPMQQTSVGWLSIGSKPVGIALATTLSESHQFAGMDDRVNALIQKKDREIISKRPVEFIEEPEVELDVESDEGEEEALDEVVEEVEDVPAEEAIMTEDQTDSAAPETDESAPVTEE